MPTTCSIATYSIVGADPEANDVGVAVQSKFLAVGAIVPWARGGVGAAAVQALPDVTVGPAALDRLANGDSPEHALDDLVRDDERAALRQTGLVAVDGRSASHTGLECFPWRGSRTGHGWAVQGNVLSGPQVLDAMAGAFTSTSGSLARRLLTALRAGQDAGGEQRGMESAALVVRRPGGGYGGNHDRMVDLRVDHAHDPIAVLHDLLEIHEHHFGRTPADQLLDLQGAVRDEVAGRLAAGGWLDDEQDLAGALERWMGWENLEERWVDAQRVDPVVLAHLRETLPAP